MWEGLTKIMGQKKQKIKNSSRVPTKAPECQRRGTRGIGHLPRVLEHGTRGRLFPIFCERLRPMLSSNAPFLLSVPVFLECCTRGRWPFSSAWLPRVSCHFRHSGKPPFPECHSSSSATLREDNLSRVPDFWHLGNSVAFGKFSFCRSDDSTGSSRSQRRNRRTTTH
jgi:hypothetical protein